MFDNLILPNYEGETLMKQDAQESTTFQEYKSYLNKTQALKHISKTNKSIGDEQPNYTFEEMGETFKYADNEV